MTVPATAYTAGAPAPPPRSRGGFASRAAELCPATHARHGAAIAQEEAAAVPEWIELVPAGTFHGRDGRGPYRLEEPEAVVAATRALSLEAGLPIDYDHATDFAAPRGIPAPAAGWVRELKVRNGAIWGRVKWTARAAAAIRAREYRYISPVFQYGPKDGRVMRLLRAGLTNNPNLYLSAISAAADKDQNMDEFLNQIKELLALGPDATAGDVLAAVAELMAASGRRAEEDGEQGAGAPDPGRYVAVTEHTRALTELNALRAERARERAEHTVNEAIRAGRLTPAQREWAVSYCAADPEGFSAFAARQPAMVRGEMRLGEKPRTAGADAQVHLTGVEAAVCAQLGVASGDYLKRKSGGADFLRLNRDNGGPGL